jgi:hypothetical protein
LSRGGDRLNSEDLTSYHRRAHLLSCRLAGTVSTQESMQVRPISARPTDSARILRTSNRQEKLRPLPPNPCFPPFYTSCSAGHQS